MTETFKVNVYNNDMRERVVARVSPNTNLDYWDGHNFTNGGTGIHKGITKLKDGSYVLIHSSQWQGSTSWAEVISPERAVQEILEAQATELFDEKKFAELKELAESLNSEMDDE